MIQLKENSTINKLYLYFYDKNNLEINICNYSWKMLWMLLTIIPATLLGLPSLIIAIFWKSHRDTTILMHMGLSWFILVFSFTFVIMLSPVLLYVNIQPLYYYLKDFIILGEGFDAIFALGIIFILFRYVYLSVINTEFITALKEKYCTEIEWVKK
jgi:hypothetical protein